MSEPRDTLTAWLRTQLSDDDLRIEGLDRVEFGHSAEMMVLTVVTSTDRRDVVLRLRPRPPALLEPYDLARQFGILRALEDTSVRAPRALWLEDSGDVLGRPFFVMERVAGDVYEMEAPQDATPQGIRHMCLSMADQLAAIHNVDLRATGLYSLADGSRSWDWQTSASTTDRRMVLSCRATNASSGCSQPSRRSSNPSESRSSIACVVLTIAARDTSIGCHCEPIAA
jgi:aminoglycoside phosphotransferase (APT) family kinase protein